MTAVWDKLDRYGPVLGVVLEGTTNANLEQLRAGLAWYYVEYERDVAADLRPTYAAAQASARTALAGSPAALVRSEDQERQLTTAGVT